MSPQAAVEISAAEWLRADADLLSFDRRVHAAELSGAELVSVSVTPPGAPEQLARAGGQIAIRYQRLAPKTNPWSTGQVFQRVLAAHRALHDLAKPLVRADFDHALDVWQWVLRLDEGAGTALQLAALFHDVERLSSEAQVRLEHLAPEYHAFKKAHARRGAQLTRSVLFDLELEPALVERAARLVAAHEQPQGDTELALLNDADGLSFFSLNSAGFLEYYGEAHTRRKVEYTLARMGPPARARLGELRHPRPVEELLSRLLPSG